MPTYNSTSIRSATQMEKNRAKIIALSTFAIALLLTFAITLTTITLSGNNDERNSQPPVGGGPIVFGVPVATFTGILKDSSLTEPQFNETMNRWESHKGITIEAPLGTPVLATFAGTVSSVTDHTMFGRMITIDHRDGLRTVYSNLDRTVNVAQGDRVEKGQKIGIVGQTRNIEFETTPHLHIMVYKDGKRIDPNDYIDFPAK